MKLKDGADRRKTAWHVSMVFRERQPVALPLLNFLRGATWRRRGVADERGGTDQASGMDKGSGTDKGRGTDKGSGTEEEGDADVGVAQMRGTTEGDRMRAAAQTRRQHR